MALMTTSDVKTILNITDSTYDVQIAYLLPLVEKDIIQYCGNAFLDKYIYRESGVHFEFVQGDSDTNDRILDSEEKFLQRGFTSTMDIYVQGGFANDGLYHLSSASTGTLKLDNYGEIVDQDQDDTKDDNYIGYIRVSRVKWPKELRLAAAKMLWYLMAEPKQTDVQSERIDDYSITYAGSYAYPTRVVKMLDKWKRPSFG